MHAALRALKEQTHDLHAQAEQYVRILDADASISDYIAYLEAMHGFHAAIETELAALDGAGFASATRCRSALALADLRALGVTAVPARCPASPALPTLAHRAGAAYVIEGSTLGGKYIFARLPAALAGLRGAATAFLDGYGAETGAQWRRFDTVIAATIDSPATEAAAIAGARETFAQLIAWLAQFAAPDARRIRVAS